MHVSVQAHAIPALKERWRGINISLGTQRLCAEHRIDIEHSSDRVRTPCPAAARTLPRCRDVMLSGRGEPRTRTNNNHPPTDGIQTAKSGPRDDTQAGEQEVMIHLLRQKRRKSATSQINPVRAPPRMISSFTLLKQRAK